MSVPLTPWKLLSSQATRVLTDFGFEAVRNPVGDEITLRACPYAELVHEHPVICDIHAELLGEVLARTTQPVTLASLDVFPRPGLCVAHLRRPDVDPEWTVEPAGPRSQSEGLALQRRRRCGPLVGPPVTGTTHHAEGIDPEGSDPVPTEEEVIMTTVPPMSSWSAPDGSWPRGRCRRTCAQ